MTPIKKINVKITHYTTIQFSCGIKLQTLRKVSSQLPVFTLAGIQSDCRQLKNRKTEEHISDGVSHPTDIKFVIIGASFLLLKEKREWRVITYATTYLLKHHHWKQNQISLCSILTASHASTRRCRNRRVGNYGTREHSPQSSCDFNARKFLECSQLHLKMNKAVSPNASMLKVRHKSAPS